ncbi:MAG: hypothetical protein Q8P18_00580 [Pseudomonadota bacterium]|nr:hypothetical protein [Pseudomonadota bacterium]
MILGLLACATPPAQSAPAAEGPKASSAFWAHWGDGKAELSSYDLVQPRYGELHPGQAVLIFVTEDFSWSERVKADPGAHPEADIRKVLKLNENRDFQTGIYPYHTMTSSFLRLDAGDRMDAFDPLKITFSAQEWCGMVYDELVMAPTEVHVTAHTYFDSDTTAPASHAMPKDVVYEDTVPVLVRGLDGAWLAPGATLTVPWWPAQMAQRFAHQPAALGTAALGTATVSRAAASAEVTVPFGTFPVDVYTVAVAGGPTTAWSVESAAPHRIVAWSSSTGEQGALRGSDRLPYWQLNKPGDVTERARLGL